MSVLYGGHSNVAPLKRVLLCPPAAAGWNDEEKSGRWQDLGFLERPDHESAAGEYGQLRDALEAAGAEVLELTRSAGLTLDAVYVHDASLITGAGAICLRMGKAARAAEPDAHREYYRSRGIPILGEIAMPGKAEAGDMIWLDENTLLVGRGYRTNAPGIEQLSSMLAPLGARVIPAPLPHGTGPETCLHLMSIVSLIDERTALVDLPLMSVETVELMRTRGIRLVEIEPDERPTLACNVLSLGRGVLLAFEQNSRTNHRLSRLGFEVRTIPGREIGINGGGGPTCLTRPILRA